MLTTDNTKVLKLQVTSEPLFLVDRNGNERGNLIIKSVGDQVERLLNFDDSENIESDGTTCGEEPLASALKGIPTKGVGIAEISFQFAADGRNLNEVNT